MKRMDRSSECETVFNGRLFSVDVVRWRDEDGKTIEREVVRHPGAVLIVPVLDDGRVVMIRNRRVAVGEQLWEFPAGTAEADEEPARTAAREVEEETGYRAAGVQPIGRFYTSPGFCDELMHVFIARGLEHVGQNLERHEEIEVQAMPMEAVRTMACDGVLRDGKSIAALYLIDAAAKKGTGVFSGGAARR